MYLSYRYIIAYHCPTIMASSGMLASPGMLIRPSSG